MNNDQIETFMRALAIGPHPSKAATKHLSYIDFLTRDMPTYQTSQVPDSFFGNMPPFSKKDLVAKVAFNLNVNRLSPAAVLAFPGTDDDKALRQAPPPGQHADWFTWEDNGQRWDKLLRYTKKFLPENGLGCLDLVEPATELAMEADVARALEASVYKPLQTFLNELLRQGRVQNAKRPKVNLFIKSQAEMKWPEMENNRSRVTFDALMYLSALPYNPELRTGKALEVRPGDHWQHVNDPANKKKMDYVSVAVMEHKRWKYIPASTETVQVTPHTYETRSRTLATDPTGYHYKEKTRREALDQLRGYAGVCKARFGFITDHVTTMAFDFGSVQHPKHAFAKARVPQSTVLFDSSIPCPVQKGKSRPYPGMTYIGALALAAVKVFEELDLFTLFDVSD